MRAFTIGPAADRRRPGTGGLTGSLLGRVAGLSAIAVAACRLTAGGVLIVVFLTVTGRRWPTGRAAWIRIIVIGLLAAFYQSCYFPAGARARRPHRDRLRLHRRRPGADAVGSGRRGHRFPAWPGGHRPADRAGHGPDRRRLHAVLPRPAVGFREHGRPADPARAADRGHPRSLAARRAAERDRDRRRGHYRHGRDPHGAGEPRPSGGYPGAGGEPR